MEDKRYTEEDLERAKAYLRQRIENELSMATDIETWLGYYAELLVMLLMDKESNHDEEIDAIIDDMKTHIYDDCMLLSVDEHGDKQSDILDYLEQFTIIADIDTRCHTFIDEVVSYVGAGLLLNETSKAITKSIKANLLNPYESDMIVRARDLVRSGAVEDVGLFDAPHFGRGIPVSSLKGLTDITQDAIGKAFWYYDWTSAKGNGAIGFIPMRGSSYPCDECGSHAGVFHEMDEDAPAYHSHCKCFVVWVYE